MNIRAYLIDGYWWHGIQFRGQLLLISRIGRAGDCLRF